MTKAETDEAEAVRAIFQEAEDYDFLRVGTVELIDQGQEGGGSPKLFPRDDQGVRRG